MLVLFLLPDKYALHSTDHLHHSNLTILSSQAGCAKFSNLCQPFGPELTSLVIHYGRQRRDSFLNNISWCWHWGRWWRIINFSSSSALTRVNWSLVVQLVCLQPAVSHCVISHSLYSVLGTAGRRILIFTISGRRRQLESSRDVDGLRGRDWKTNGCDKKYSSSSSEKNHPNKSFLISSHHQEQRFSQLHLCLIYLVLVSLIHCAGKTGGSYLIILPPT